MLISEGSTILYRIGIAILRMNRKALYLTKTKTQFHKVLSSHVQQLHNSADLLQVALEIEFKKKKKSKRVVEPAQGEIQHLRSGVIPYYFGPTVTQPSAIIENQEVCILVNFSVTNFSLVRGFVGVDSSYLV